MGTMANNPEKKAAGAVTPAAQTKRKSHRLDDDFHSYYSISPQTKTLQFPSDFSDLRATIQELESRALSLRKRADRADEVAMECESTARSLRMDLALMEKSMGACND